MNEQHVSSLIVYISPEKMQVCSAQLDAIDGAELITVSTQGKAIVVVEGNSQGEIMECIDNINALQGVLSSNLVYHQFASSEPSYSEERQ